VGVIGKVHAINPRPPQVASVKADEHSDEWTAVSTPRREPVRDFMKHGVEVGAEDEPDVMPFCLNNPPPP